MSKITKYLRSTGEFIEIKKMDSNHLYNARNVVKRTTYTKLDKNGVDLVVKGIDQELYEALDKELKTRPTQEYLKPIYIMKRSK